MSEPDVVPAYLSPAEVAIYTKVSTSTLAGWRGGRGDGPPKGPPFVRTPGGMIRYPLADLRNWLDAHTVIPFIDTGSTPRRSAA